MFIVENIPALQATMWVAVFSGMVTIVFVVAFILWNIRDDKKNN